MKQYLKILLWCLCITLATFIVMFIFCDDITKEGIQVSYFQLMWSVLIVQYVATMVLMRMIKL